MSRMQSSTQVQRNTLGCKIQHQGLIHLCAQNHITTTNGLKGVFFWQLTHLYEVFCSWELLSSKSLKTNNFWPFWDLNLMHGNLNLLWDISFHYVPFGELWTISLQLLNNCGNTIRHLTGHACDLGLEHGYWNLEHDTPCHDTLPSVKFDSICYKSFE